MSTFKELYQLLEGNIAQVIKGKEESIRYAIITMLCRGHLLLEDVPGVGKTLLARSLAQSINAKFNRVQCTPDLLPSDVTGVSIFNQQQNNFEFHPGPVFTNILLADEINRATPRTQACLMECMAEGQVTLDGTTRTLPNVFMVLATQNPIEFQGTFPLPEAQLDRFFMRVDMGYPSEEEELRVMSMQIQTHPVNALKSVLSAEHIASAQDLVTKVRVDDKVARYIAGIVRATRAHKDLRLGSSPRGSIALMKAAQAAALINGQNFVSPDTVKAMAVPVLAHRLILRGADGGNREGAVQAITDILATVAVPV
ncbi:MAG TPA: MoxR family ATPase [Pseudomonadales bacterium]|nr:MoxR family ATPase [Pseudomonadales bacterium]